MYHVQNYQTSQNKLISNGLTCSKNQSFFLNLTAQKKYIYIYTHTLLNIYSNNIKKYDIFYVFFFSDIKGLIIFQWHHNVVLLARISLTLSRHLSLSFIASGRSSGLHPVSSQSCCMYVQAGHPAFSRPCVGVHLWVRPCFSSNVLHVWFI